MHQLPNMYSIPIRLRFQLMWLVHIDAHRPTQSDLLYIRQLACRISLVKLYPGQSTLGLVQMTPTSIVHVPSFRVVSQAQPPPHDI